jgi:hypothetical protein
MYRGDGKRFVVRADEKLTAFVELESETRNSTLLDSHCLGSIAFFRNVCASMLACEIECLASLLSGEQSQPPLEAYTTSEVTK